MSAFADEEDATPDEVQQHLALWFPTLNPNGLLALQCDFELAMRRVRDRQARGFPLPDSPPKHKPYGWWRKNKNSGSPYYRAGRGGSTAGPRKKKKIRQLPGFRMKVLLKENELSGRWRAAWRARQALTATTTTATATATTSTLRPLPPSYKHKNKDLLPRPPLPAPLAPCLQCVLAGSICSLTTKPYARDYGNDRVQAAPTTTTTTNVTTMTAAALWKEGHARLIRAHEHMLATDRAADPGRHRLHAALARHRQVLEQCVLRLAVARGECDAPFLARPPKQCARCTRTGDAACLQQSVDLAALVDDKDVAVAWFASSGPPPVSLLPQHGRSVAEQLAVVTRGDDEDGDGEDDKDGDTSGCPYRHRHRPRSRPLPPLRLEAVFCRDPAVLSAPAIAAKAKHMLARIARHATTHRVRPAMPRELMRLLPRRSPYNPYAGRGVATARPVATDNGDDADAENDALLLPSACVPAPIPSWNKPDRNTQKPAPYSWEDSLDVGEQQTALPLRQLRQQESSFERPLSFLNDDSDSDDDDDDSKTLTPPKSPATPPPTSSDGDDDDDSYTLSAEPRHRAILRHALALYRAANPQADADEDDGDAPDDPCFFTTPPSTPPSPNSPASPHSTQRNYRPWSEEQAEALLDEEDGEDVVQKRRRQQQQELRALADRFGVSLEWLVERRRQYKRGKQSG